MSTYPTYSGIPVAELDVNARANFITRTYMHLFGAIIGFTVLEVIFFSTGFAQSIYNAIAGGGRTGWLLVLGGFMVVAWLATFAAHRAESQPLQYLGLGGYVVAESIIFAPLLLLASQFDGLIQSAALITLIGFGGLTAIVFVTRKDFSFLRGILMWGGFIALALIVMGALFGFQLGVFFSVGMIALAGGSILYNTSNVLLHYPEDRYVGASLELFAAVALLFWYVLRLLLASRR